MTEISCTGFAGCPNRVSVEKENGRGFFLPRGITPFRISDNVLLHRPFTLCRACVDSPTYAAQKYLTLRIGREMGRHIGLPLRKCTPTVVPLCYAYAVYHLRPSYPRARGRFTKRRKPLVSSFLCACGNTLRPERAYRCADRVHRKASAEKNRRRSVNPLRNS